MNNADQYTTPKQNEKLLEAFSRQAKKLHKAAVSGQKVDALPILRRLLRANIFSDIALPQLFEQSQLIKRKHMFQLIAAEMDYKSWAELKQFLGSANDTECYHYSMRLKDSGYPNLWFSNIEQAESYAKLHGGQPIKVGNQAVLIVEG